VYVYVCMSQFIYRTFAHSIKWRCGVRYWYAFCLRWTDSTEPISRRSSSIGNSPAQGRRCRDGYSGSLTVTLALLRRFSLFIMCVTLWVLLKTFFICYVILCRLLNSSICQSAHVKHAYPTLFLSLVILLFDFMLEVFILYIFAVFCVPCSPVFRYFREYCVRTWYGLDLCCCAGSPTFSLSTHTLWYDTLYFESEIMSLLLCFFIVFPLF